MEIMVMAGMFAVTVLVMLIAFECGYRLANANQRTEREKEASVSAIAGSVLGLTAFMLAFTFGIAANRYGERKALVREEANAIGTAYLRSDILPPAERIKAQELFKQYADDRLEAAQSRDHILLQRNRDESARIHRELWSIALHNAQRNMNSVTGLYMASINKVIDIHGLRMAVVQVHIPIGIWIVLYTLLFLGMGGVGYHTVITGSRRSWAILLLVSAFSLVIALIAALDRPQSVFVKVPQQPLADVRASME